MALVCAKAGCPAFFLFFRKKRLQHPVCNQISGVSFIEMSCAARCISRPREYIIPRGRAARPRLRLSSLKAAGCFIIDGLKLQVVNVKDPTILISPVIPRGLSKEAKVLCETRKQREGAQLSSHLGQMCLRGVL